MDPNRAYGQPQRGAVACTGKWALSAVALLQSRCSERSPPLWPGINAALTLQGDADRFMQEARAGKGV